MKLNDYTPTSDLSLARTIPARWYTEPEFLELEKEKIFWKTWQSVGRADMVLRSGDFFTRDLLGEPLLISRGPDGELRAFYNVCRHRAGPVAVGKGNRKSLQCRYHGWTYGLDGRLLTAPEFEGVKDWRQERVDTFRYYSSQYAPIRPLRPADQMPGRDRRYLRLEEEAQALYYWVFPNLMLNFYPDNMQINIIIPLDHERTLTIFEWYFQQPGTGQGWESMQRSIAFSDQIQQEDIEICETVQKGLQSRSYNQGRFSVKRENGVHHFQSLVHEFLAR